MKLSLKRKWMILRGTSIALTALVIAGALFRRMWLVAAGVALVVPWLIVQQRWWRCPACGRSLGPLERIRDCPHCGEELGLRKKTGETGGESDGSE